MLWAVFAMMTSAVVLALTRSLSERCEGLGAHDVDVAFYRGLLAEADDDVRCGLVAPEDAVATRSEIGRRLLVSLNSASEVRPRLSWRWQSRRIVAALAIVLVLPLVGLASYLKVGAPSQPDMPIASRRRGGDVTLAAAVPDIHAGQTWSDIAALAPEQRSDAIRGMVGGLAENLSKNGHDLQGWLQLIRSYDVLGERQKAEAAVASARSQLADDAEAPARIDELVRQLGLKG
ncbi:c-type cytochrome biogenesis protein CcmI [Bradyrhizobium sp. Arg816]|uniref:c-type cytochrome biogenesis protein CcmI n=1 Tax=Bradyrhizobium sp. Arg816 TaxID=2998491 RepID=UPI00249ECB6E|nr:c-type cytochrome biogenesis protein CcmI [Bradyrhizobium sp. Arg816]MDI3561797.1 c-type cytochrome biogenesis protein CcmI [Bradyrhizobium sp. Arg816]